MGRLRERLDWGTAWLAAFSPHPSSLPRLKSLLQQYPAPLPPQLCARHPPVGTALPFILLTALPVVPSPLYLFQKVFLKPWPFTENSFVLALDQDKFSGPFYWLLAPWVGEQWHHMNCNSEEYFIPSRFWLSGYHHLCIGESCPKTSTAHPRTHTALLHL